MHDLAAGGGGAAVLRLNQIVYDFNENVRDLGLKYGHMDHFSDKKELNGSFQMKYRPFN